MADYFNYISFGAREAVEVPDGRISLSRRRLFEYTPDHIREPLAGLGREALDFIAAQPTFLCSEVTRDGRRASILVKYGRLSEVALHSDDLAAVFETELDFGELWFDDVDAAREVFGADPFQLFRTHWAVREGDVHAILVKLLEASPEKDADVLAGLAGDEAAVDPPVSPQKRTLGAAASVEAFLDLLFKVEAGEAVETFFRGQDVATYPLEPSLLRKRPDGGWKHLPNEDRLCKELLIAHYDEFENDQYCFDRLVRMQHFGLPTRLLDISGNPLIALFFACDGGPAGVNPEVEGEVVIFRVKADRVKYYDSDTVSCLANLCRLTHEQKNELQLNQSFQDFNADPVVGKLVHYIHAEKPYFQTAIEPAHLGSILCVKAKQTNTRIKSQLGAFLLFGHDATMAETGQDGIDIARITIVDKARILKDLDRLNINAKTVYPSIDRTAEHLKTRYAMMGEANSKSAAASDLGELLG